MTECDEVARSISAKVGLTCLRGLRSMRDAEALANLYMGDESYTIRNNVAAALLRLAREKGNGTR
ncbi:MAG: hypothetical protein ACHP9V_05910 [Terriglobales bacterium]